MRGLLSLGIAAVVVSGCGAAARGPGHAAGPAPIYADAAAPPVVAVDEAPPALVAGFLRAELDSYTVSGVDTAGAGAGQTCITSWAWGTPSAPTSTSPAPSSPMSCSPATPAQFAQMQVQQEQWRQAIAPAAGSEPRTIAKLPLTGGGTAWLTGWTTASGALCWEETAERADGGGGGGGPHGPCADGAGGATAGAPPCDAFCLSSSGSGDGHGSTTYVLSGTVPADAEAIRVTLAGGAAPTYPLTGPAFLAATDRRVFMLELGTHDWRTLELIRDGAVAQTMRMPASEAAFEECSATLGPPQPTPAAGQPLAQAMQPYDDQMNACLAAAAPASPSP